MRYDPARHHRRSTRLPAWDYRRAGAYLVTLVAHERETLFGEIVEGDLVPSEYGEVAARCWQEIPAHFSHVKLDEWILMPNHLHGIIIIVDGLEAINGCWGEALPRPNTAPRPNPNPGPNNDPDDQPIRPYPPRGCKPGSLGAIIGSFKSIVTRRINELRDTPGNRVWQRNYYEHIIRNERELDAIRRYIQSNTLRWEDDRENPN